MGRGSIPFAAIDIGSHRLRMKVVEIRANGSIRQLENVELMVPLGRDTFNDGKLSFESVRTTCEAIAGFRQLMASYGVRESRVVATSALREASNRDYMLDQIRTMTGLDVHIINNAQEKFLTFQAVKEVLQRHKAMREKEDLLLLDIGAGSIQLSHSDPFCLLNSQSMKIGALRIKEAMSRMEKHTIRFSGVLEEYIEAHVESVDSFQRAETGMRFAVVAGESEILAELGECTEGEELQRLSKTRFEKVFQRVEALSVPELAGICGIPETGAEVIMPVLILIRKFLRKSGASEVMLPHVSLVDGLIAERLLSAVSHAPGRRRFMDDMLSHATRLAERYQYNQTHTAYVVKASLSLFDGLRRLHGMGPDERLLLHMAALLHDTGKFIGADPHYEYSYNIIVASQLPGLSDSELASVANIARFHSAEDPDFDHESLMKLDTATRLRTVKLIAIIRLADALDTSHKQKISNIHVELRGGICRIRGESRADIALEQSTFGAKAAFFREVFGLLPALAITSMAGKPEEA